MPRAYAFKSPFRRTGARMIDAVGDVLIAPWLRRRPVPPNLRKLLILRLDHLGDVIAILPLLQQIASSPGRPRVTVAVDPSAAILLRDTPWTEEVLTFAAPWFSREKRKLMPGSVFKELSRRLRMQGFDAAIDLRGDARHIAIFTMARIPFRVGYGQTGGGFLLHREISLDATQPITAQNLATLSCFGFHPNLAAVSQLPWKATKDEQAWLSQAVVARPFVAVHADAGTPAKRWPREHWATLLRSLARRKDSIVLCGVDAACGTALEQSLSGLPVLNLMGKTTLAQLVTLLQSAEAVLSADSGPAHIAAALGRPTFILWSGTNRPEIWLPRGELIRWCRHDVSCQPCGFERCPLPRHLCMEDLRPAEVLPAVISFLEEARRAPSAVPQ